jgi:hypothetical protein
MNKPTLTDTQIELLRHGIRWAANIITELSGNYATRLPGNAGHNIRTALSCLHEAEREISAYDPTKGK